MYEVLASTHAIVIEERQSISFTILNSVLEFAEGPEGFLLMLLFSIAALVLVMSDSPKSFKYPICAFLLWLVVAYASEIIPNGYYEIKESNFREYPQLGNYFQMVNLVMLVSYTLILIYRKHYLASILMGAAFSMWLLKSLTVCI